MSRGASILPLRLEGVSYAPDGHTLLHAISLTLAGDAATVVLGPNGAGKSLLLRLCHGLIPPSTGRILWAGDASKGQAMVFQRPVMLRRSVAANLAYPLRWFRLAREERERRVAEALAMAGLTPLAARHARSLSGGEQQRLALARAWVRRPEVLFLDEPTANLDPAATRQVEAIVKTFRDNGTKVVMTTHDLGQARRLAEEVLFLHRGRLLEDAQAERFFAGPATAEACAFVQGELLW
ncbi:MAG: ATP-binding cassette domain-containing protein [Pseudomonadota bacterium]|nr:ATP-binding cassette domain-containing protein [Pseudomonadota bacterium]